MCLTTVIRHLGGPSQNIILYYSQKRIIVNGDEEQRMKDNTSWRTRGNLSRDENGKAVQLL